MQASAWLGELPTVKQGTVERRAYQEQLAARCLEKNSLLVLPTGLGKTVVAGLVAASRLHEFPDGKVLFLAPTKPLVGQHLKSFGRMLSLKTSQLGAVSGEVEPGKRKESYDGFKVVFATPQTVYNDLVSRRLDLSAFCLVVFDEAHRAVGNYPYVYIAERYVKEATRPLILGLTASPGSERTKVFEVCRNLSIQRVEVRTESSVDVKPYVQRVDVDWRYASLPDSYLRIRSLLYEALRKRLRKLVESGLDIPTSPSDVSRRDLLRLKSELAGRLQEAEDAGALLGNLGLLAVCIRISHAIELLEAQGLGPLRSFLDKLERLAERPGASRGLKELVNEGEWLEVKHFLETGEGEVFEHPKMPLLLQTLREQLTRNPSSRIIVFVHYRDSANVLLEELRKVEGARSIRFVGQAARGKERGLTQREQLAVLDGFRAGMSNVLVATQVAEEGIDVSECDLVVFYDNVPSAVRFIQRAGRTGRGRPGRVVVLIAKRTRDEAYYWSAIRKKKRMASILRTIREIGDTLERGEAARPQLKLEAYVAGRGEEGQVAPVRRAKVVADSRELGSPVVLELMRRDVDVEPKTLEVGDYVLSDRVVVERKTVDDFVASIMDRRLFDQLATLKRSYQQPLVILEKGEGPTRSIHPEAFLGAVTSVILDFGVPMVWSENAQMTARYLHTIARREQVDRQRVVAIKSEKLPATLKEQQERVAASLPGVDVVRARRLLSSHKSLKKLFSASEESLASVEGIGKVLAERLNKVFDAVYE